MRESETESAASGAGPAGMPFTRRRYAIACAYLSSESESGLDLGILLCVYVKGAVRLRPIYLFLNGAPACGVWQLWQTEAQSSRP